MSLSEWASLGVLAVSLMLLLDWLALYARAFGVLHKIQAWVYVAAICVLMFGVFVSAAPQRSDITRLEQHIERQEGRLETLTAQLMQHQVQVAGRLAALETSVESNNAILTSILLALILMIVGGAVRFLWGMKGTGGKT